ncbi:MAG: thioredoxin family protein [Kofleriaceae bacterium]
MILSFTAFAPVAGAEPKAPPAKVAPAVTATKSAEIGKPAPDFTLKDLNGKTVKLSALRGKTVVLEWFNPGCPFVKRSHEIGSLVDTAKRRSNASVVWLAINSNAPGKQGSDPKANADAAKRWSMAYPILMDDTGATGKAYGATNTPHMFVIDNKGVLVYAGGIDNSPDAEQKSPEGGKLIKYVEAALDDLAAGKPVTRATSKAYGCSVKYGS